LPPRDINYVPGGNYPNGLEPPTAVRPQDKPANEGPTVQAKACERALAGGKGEGLPKFNRHKLNAPDELFFDLLVPGIYNAKKKGLFGMSRGSQNLEAIGIRIIFRVDGDGVVPEDLGPTLDARHNGRLAGHANHFFHPPLKERPDDTFV
jgi:hypothetical protein